ncbi:ADP-ribosylation factor-like protein 6-interacting protein 6 [Diorhabda sublineata]|uniref:ADP-ribosylation factor-like protein 6-interacting protein 6 n=1 Tax=Diorhabda sublineata TaxID=1163346 RepID=UPI0024E0ABB4|nr:ADP-ribosylation factor-like protein 6-interacting protein 6 [Diorhabda sublineata]
MLRERLSARSSTSPYYFVRKDNIKEDVPIWTEWKIAAYGLFFSVLIFTVKLFIIYRSTLEQIFLEEKLISYQIWSEDGQEMFAASWKHVARYSNIWLPILGGVLSSYFTWIMVYLDSAVPGVQPPSPLSPKKYKEQSGHTFHLNYVFAIVVGFLVSGYMYFRGVSIVY